MEHGRITEDGLDQLRNRIGKEYAIEWPFIRYVNLDSISHVARALGDMNPLYVDPAYAADGPYGDLIAPPALFYAIGWGSWDLRRGEGLPGVHGLHSGDTWWYLRPAFDGDEIRATKQLIDIRPMSGRLAGDSMLMQDREIKYFNSQNELVARQEMHIIRAERPAAKRGNRYSEIPPSAYRPEEIEDFDTAIHHEAPAGKETRYFEDVAVGDDIDSVTKGPLTVADEITWLQGIGSPHIRSGKYWVEYRRRSPAVAVPDPISGIPESVERVHWDNYMASQIGMPAAYDYGSQRGGYATYFLTNWMSDAGWLSFLDVEYRGMVFLGDVLTISGSVVDKRPIAPSGSCTVDIEFSARNQRGDVVMPGMATIALPSREHGPVTFPVVTEQRRLRDE